MRPEPCQPAQSMCVYFEKNTFLKFMEWNDSTFYALLRIAKHFMFCIAFPLQLYHYQIYYIEGHQLPQFRSSKTEEEKENEP